MCFNLHVWKMKPLYIWLKRLDMSLDVEVFNSMSLKPTWNRPTVFSSHQSFLSSWSTKWLMSCCKFYLVLEVGPQASHISSTIVSICRATPTISPCLAILVSEMLPPASFKEFEEINYRFMNISLKGNNSYKESSDDFGRSSDAAERMWPRFCSICYSLWDMTP